MKKQRLFLLGVLAIGIFLVAAGTGALQTTKQEVLAQADTAMSAEEAAENRETIPLDEVHFPGEKFRSYLSIWCDLDKDGSLSWDERQRVTKMKISRVDDSKFKVLSVWDSAASGPAVRTEEEKVVIKYDDYSVDLTGISYFTELKNLELVRWNLRGAKELEQLQKLKKLDLWVFSGDEEITAPRFTFLESLGIDESTVVNWDLSLFPNLKKLDMGKKVGTPFNKKEESFQLKELDISRNPKLEVLYCAGTGLETLDLSKSPKLRRLDCSGNLL